MSSSPKSVEKVLDITEKKFVRVTRDATISSVPKGATVLVVAGNVKVLGDIYGKVISVSSPVTISGRIKQGASVSSTDGHIKAHYVETGSTVTTVSGSIDIDKLEPDVKLKVKGLGKAYVGELIAKDAYPSARAVTTQSDEVDIAEGEKIVLKQDTAINNIGNNATLIIENGSLTISGSIGNNVKIKLRNQPTKTAKELGFSSCVGNVIIDGVNTHHLNILGPIGSNVRIQTTATTIAIASDEIGSKLQVNASDGRVDLACIPDDSEIKSTNGQITTNKASAKATIHTTRAGIEVRQFTEAKIFSLFGKVRNGKAEAHASQVRLGSPR